MKTYKSNILRYILPSLTGRGRGVGLLLAIFLVTSCADLDSDKYFGDRKTLESVFTDRQQVDQWLAHAYSFLDGCNFEVCSKGATGADGGNWNPFNFADDMYYGDRDNTFGDSKDADYASYNSFREGNYDESVGQNSWVRCYQGINQATLFMQNIDSHDWNYDLSLEDRIDRKGQARFVRAYYYWLLLRKFGPVPILPDEGVDYTLEYDDLATPRATYEECAEWIASEMLKAAGELKYYTRDESNVMRPTIGAALAVRAIVYTYAASPLANGQLKNGEHPENVSDNIAKELKNFDGTYLLSLDYDESKWARAAAACKDVMDLGVYDLYTESYNDVASDGTPHTVTPPDTVIYGPNSGAGFEDNFANQNWPKGWKNIDPYLSYRNLFNGIAAPSSNPELIFTRGNMNKNDHDNGIGSLVLHSMPVSVNGWNTHGLTQKMVDTYYMKDGTDVDGMYKEWRTPGATTTLNPGNDNPRPEGFITRAEAQSGNYPEVLVNPTARSSVQMQQLLQVAHQYVGREPRFYASVAYNGTLWEMLKHPTSSLWNSQITYYRGGTDGYKNSFSYLRTGIGMKKYYNPNDYIPAQNSYDGICEKFEPAIRYADILLQYAEALNELTQSYTLKNWKGEDVTISRNIEEMKKGIQPVRIRAGLHDYPAADYADANKLRARIKRERMIEFMAEGKRYFDLRRWMDAPIEENKRVYGLNVFQTSANKDDFMQVIPVYNLSATFTDKMYFWPISFTDLKRNKNLVQNPGWKYND
ncbi:MAG: RagB/SusD family nutrient uptake outer membrane protein [Bacteroidaceae bacterium]|nr:RagB/SusD family nutrient uptake outer membrane protein [Bacteroidaceae bacterium]MBR1664966.1 RagB/SusD family nutrient uptake outer membrane protein [Bacteroidaceae bacterium]